ncbi:zinc-binding dehydrogenase [Streptomyces sp. NPDC032940]|uniref:zinc-binding dehydrogenase n=1 Tax=Streptomyces sp. NPDC032940 TaxID=3155366 RepID=UPI0033E7727F
MALTSAAKAAALEEAGASATLPRDADPAELERRLARTAPEGLDAVADVAGGPWLERLLPALRENGRWVIAGAVAGPVVTFDLRRLYLHNLRLIGSSMHTRAHFAALAGLARTGHVRPRVAESFPLGDIHAAQRAFRAGRHVGKITVIP